MWVRVFKKAQNRVESEDEFDFSQVKLGFWKCEDFASLENFEKCEWVFASLEEKNSLVCFLILTWYFSFGQLYGGQDPKNRLFLSKIFLSIFWWRLSWLPSGFAEMSETWFSAHSKELKKCNRMSRYRLKSVKPFKS